jgi:alkanesulfonate monooxygenase SsuD/methylene tetrahydromethanopterin reductase-like flavin-dependent oxidoreductase (luciferase family)
VLDAMFSSPIVLARRLATLDRLSAGRLLAGLGQGWMSEEYTATNIPWKRRGAGFAEHIDAMRAAWGPDPVRFDGRFYRIPESQFGPKPVRAEGPTLLVGATTPPAVRRAAWLGTGLCLVMFDWDGLAATVSLFRDTASAARGNATRQPVVVQVNGSLTATARDERAALTGSARQVATDLRRLQALGVDHVLWAMDTAPEDQLDALAQLHVLVAS